LARIALRFHARGASLQVVHQQAKTAWAGLSFETLVEKFPDSAVRAHLSFVADLRIVDRLASAWLAREGMYFCYGLNCEVPAPASPFQSGPASVGRRRQRSMIDASVDGNAESKAGGW